METIVTILLAAYAVFYIALGIIYFFGKRKHLRKWLNYSTIILLVLIALLVISLAINGTLFTFNQQRPYF